MACRVATSTEGVWYDGESFDVTAVKGVFTVVSLRCVPLYNVKRSVATTDSLDAGWLRSIREHDHAWVWWDAASGKAAAMALDEDADGEIYAGRNWSPYAPEVTRLLGPPVAGEDCYTAQYAVPDAAADAAVASIQKIAGAGLVEVKFLPPSAMLPGAAAMCFNVYVAAPAPAWVLGVERALAAVGGVAHPGKCCATDV